MQLAFSSNAYTQFPIEEAIARIAAAGYTGLELLADVPHAWPVGLLPERRQAIRDCLAAHNLTVSNVNGFMMNAVADPRQPYWHPRWIEPDPHYRAIRREHTKRALILAKEMGAKNLQTEPGGPLAPGQTWSDAADMFYEELMPCVELAEKLEVGLLIEPEPDLMIETIWPVPGVHRPDRFPVGRLELRYWPCVLRGRGSAGVGCPKWRPMPGTTISRISPPRASTGT